MDDRQMERLIAGIRENESKSQTLSETLMGFSEAFTRLMAQIEDVGKLRDLQISQEKIVSLEENLAGIKEDLECIHTAQMSRLSGIEKTLKAELKHELKEEILASIEGLMRKRYIPSAENTLTIGEKVYVIDASRKVIRALNKQDEAGKIVYESENAISGILKAYNEANEEQLLIHLENGEVRIFKNL